MKSFPLDLAKVFPQLFCKGFARPSGFDVQNYLGRLLVTSLQHPWVSPRRNFICQVVAMKSQRRHSPKPPSKRVPSSVGAMGIFQAPSLRSTPRIHTKTGLWGHFPSGVTFDWKIFWTSGFVWGWGNTLKNSGKIKNRVCRYSKNRFSVITVTF